jgi:3-oxoadipate CoA-transferase beta subunit
MMEHQTKTGQSKIVDQCTYPLTGVACVSRIYTDLAVIDIVDGELLVRDMAEGLTLNELATLSGVPLRAA